MRGKFRTGGLGPAAPVSESAPVSIRRRAGDCPPYLHGRYSHACSRDAHLALPRDRLGANIQNKTKGLTYDQTEFLENKRSRRVCFGGGENKPLCRRGRKASARGTDWLWLVRKDRFISSDPGCAGGSRRSLRCGQ